jgi:hypothetical protein
MVFVVASQSGLGVVVALFFFYVPLLLFCPYLTELS